MKSIIGIRGQETLPTGFSKLVELSLGEGFKFVEKMQSEWISRKNRFNSEGEICYALFFDNILVAVCGLNIDPYTNEANVGRIRHLYVHPEFRRKGLGETLVKKILDESKGKFKTIRLRTDSSNASNFYCSIGFVKQTGEEYSTHIWNENAL
ncbi:MAG: GNAT family N-acetyltransferase [Nanoarchaeota archaeon]|nr:GNAT family N-acetyltransferase [Nanoarchaeota archaeon]